MAKLKNETEQELQSRASLIVEQVGLTADQAPVTHQGWRGESGPVVDKLARTGRDTAD